MKKNIPLFKRLFIAKSLWFLFWIIGFIVLPMLMQNDDLMLRFWILFWYTTLWAIVWLMWFITHHPLFKLSFPYYVRGALIWGWMNFVLLLFTYDTIKVLIENSFFQGLTPYSFIIEWMIIWWIIDIIVTKYAGEWKDLINNK